MSVYRKFPFLKGVPKNKYDSTFREHVPDIETLLTHNVLVEFTQVELPETMPYMRSLQDELRTLKRRGSRGKCEYPDAAYINRMNELFPLRSTKYETDEYYWMYYKMHTNRNIIDYEEYNFKECAEIDLEYMYAIRKYNDYWKIHKYNHFDTFIMFEMDIDHEADTGVDADADTDADVDYKYSHYNDYKISRYIKFVDEQCSYNLHLKNRQEFEMLFSIMRGVASEIKTTKLDISIKNLLVCATFFPYLDLDCTEIINYIYKKYKNLAIRMLLYPEFDVFRTISAKVTLSSMDTYYFPYYSPSDYVKYEDFLKWDAGYVKNMHESLCTYMNSDDKYTHLIQRMPAYFGDMSHTKLFGLCPNDTEDIYDNETLKRMYPDLDTLVSRFGTGNLDKIIGTIKCTKVKSTHYPKYVFKHFPHYKDLLMKYWFTNEWNKNDSTFFDYKEINFMENTLWINENKSKYYLSVKDMIPMCENGTIMSTKRVDVDQSIISEVKNTGRLPVSNDYELLASIVDTVLEQEWCADLSTVTLYSFILYSRKYESRRTIIEMIYQKDYVLGVLLSKFARVEPYTLVCFMNYVDNKCSKRGDHYKYFTDIFSNYWSMITTPCNVLMQCDEMLTRRIKKIEDVFTVPVFFKNTAEKMEKFKANYCKKRG